MEEFKTQEAAKSHPRRLSAGLRFVKSRAIRPTGQTRRGAEVGQVREVVGLQRPVRARAGGRARMNDPRDTAGNKNSNDGV